MFFRIEFIIFKTVSSTITTYAKYGLPELLWLKWIVFSSSDSSFFIAVHTRNREHVCLVTPLGDWDCFNEMEFLVDGHWLNRNPSTSFDFSTGKSLISIQFLEKFSAASLIIVLIDLSFARLFVFECSCDWWRVFQWY